MLRPVANRFTATESLTKKVCNGLLQQNLPGADIQLSHSITTPSLLAHGNCQDYLKSHNQRNRCAARARHRALIGARLARAAGAVNAWSVIPSGWQIATYLSRSFL